MLKDKIKKLRNEENISQRKLAKFLNLSPSTIAMYEIGERKPDIDTLQKIADYFNISVDYLLGRTNERAPADKLILKDKNTNVEIKELLNRFNVHLDGEFLTEEDKESVITLLQMLRNRNKKKP
ncbi:helix-turn-helix domain-containing protein [Iocasia frigidifontis]|uniref:Helix-turn-helix domain-containing protein n=1 Tax=Iocasia fonsfrigidae TaxID=2682810 RepID=A0A8A7KD14_9FIRM|nr:helix-turn-helix domain-containing protein [Iocasia fonsfrigidae]QTL96777.1 helix-turn-helix domain-containing protein [Iocasia fonsfrigidae]